MTSRAVIAQHGTRQERKEHPGYLAAARLAFCKSGPAAWDPLPHGFALGSGPTILSTIGEVSSLPQDVALVVAAGRGNVEEVAELLTHASSPNVRTRCGSSHSHATTALHAAAAQGSFETVKALIAAGADPKRQQSGLRMLTPLHEAANVAVAELLLLAGASPISMDPREPEPAWYHRQHNRPDVAAAIAAADASSRANSGIRPASAQRNRRRPSSASSTNSRQSGVGSRNQVNPPPAKKAFPCMTASEVAAARHSWTTSGNALRAAGRGASLEVSNVSVALKAEPEMECAICMGGLFDKDECIVLPCNGGCDLSASLGSASTCSGFSTARQSTASSSNNNNNNTNKICFDDAVAASSSRSPHAFHSACLVRWWAKSCQCPTCRRDVRQWLPKDRHATGGLIGNNSKFGSTGNLHKTPPPTPVKAANVCSTGNLQKTPPQTPVKSANVGPTSNLNKTPPPVPVKPATGAGRARPSQSQPVVVNVRVPTVLIPPPPPALPASRARTPTRTPVRTPARTPVRIPATVARASRTAAPRRSSSTSRRSTAKQQTRRST